MNLFVLDRDPVTAATMYCDTHVCKIILESLQMMGLAHICHGVTKCLLSSNVVTFPYAKSHTNNPVSIWVRTTIDNYKWTAAHAIALCNEYTSRYKKIHAYTAMIKWCYNNYPPLPIASLTPFVQNVAEDCFSDDAVTAYRQYYLTHKSHLARWKKGNVPYWYENNILIGC